MKNSTTTSKYPLPKDKIWTRLPERVKALEDNALEDNAPKYKVFTALLTQIGGDDTQFVTNSALTIGTTYMIDYIGSPVIDGDFTNVGAPNNDVGTYFIATGTTPNSWGVNSTLRYNPGAPTVTVLENTIGNIWFTYNTIGRYSANSDSLFTLSKTYSTIESQAIDTVGDGIKTATITYDNPVDDAVVINTGIVSDQQFDSFLTNTPFEIRVYN